ncbi:MAG TPA: replicative DNA helicase [Leptospiraceae bacterium]|nr:replicative DNA helicase [Leptospiraceae bacterium]
MKIPNNIESEKVVIQKLLVKDRDAVEAIIDYDENLFFDDANKAILKQIVSDIHSGTDYDLLSIHSALENNKCYKECGGRNYLESIRVDYNFGFKTHFENVKKAYHYRSLLDVNQKIQLAIVQNPENLGAKLKQYEYEMFELNRKFEDRKANLERAGDISNNVIADIDKIVNSTSKYTGLPTGIQELDEMTMGLHRGDSTLVAGRPGAGKSAFSGTVFDYHITKNKDFVGAFFNLEMPKTQILQRLISSIGHIPLGKIRSGKLSDYEWARFLYALDVINESKLYIDDSVNLNTVSLENKIKNLTIKEKKVDLVIVDYLQLMTPLGNKGSREQEVAQISRGIKLAAKSLNVPIVALSQLSRSPENRMNHRPVLSDLRDSGCLSGDTMIKLSDGSDVRIDSLVGSSDVVLPTLNNNLASELDVASKIFCSGIKPTYTLKTRSGRQVRATGNHKFLTDTGWVELESLNVGDRIAIPNNITLSEVETMSINEASLLGQMLGNGCMLPRHSIQYTTGREEMAEHVVHLASTVFGDKLKPRYKRERSWYQVYLSSSYRLTRNKRNPVTEWATRLGVFGLRSYEKYIPEVLFSQPVDVILAFIRNLWSTDGTFRKRCNTNRKSITISYSSSSSALAVGLQRLLQQVGIFSTIKTVKESKGRDGYVINVRGRQSIVRFCSAVGAVDSERKFQLDCLLKDLLATKSCTNNSSYKAEGDVVYDFVESICSTGTLEPVYDITVPKNHNFIANGILVHNSSEQDADNVFFIYRDEMYTPTSENKNLAELIVAKQRNGPIGTVHTAFIKEFTKFMNVKF